MPCRSDEYPTLNEIEEALYFIYRINDELDGRSHQKNLYYKEVQLKKVTSKDLDFATSELCNRLQDVSNIHEHSITLHNWWQKHRITDFKRLIIKREKVVNKFVFSKTLSDYEFELITSNKFLEEIVDSCILRTTNTLNKLNDIRKLGLNDTQVKSYRQNRLRDSFVDVLNAFELFCQLIYIREFPDTMELEGLFRTLERGELLWKEIFNSTYSDWLTPQDYSALKLYFDKYFLFCGFLKRGASIIAYRILFRKAIESNEEIIKRNVEKSEALNLIRIILILKNKISELQAVHNKA